MGMSTDMAREAERRKRFWQRIRREKALEGDNVTDHASEYADVIEGERAHFKQLAKIHHMRRRGHN